MSAIGSRRRLSEMVGPDSLTAYLEDASKAREALLERLAEQIRRRLPGIQVTVDSTDGVIRFRADELFPTGTWRIPPGSLAERVSHAVGDALAETLPCYTLSPQSRHRGGMWRYRSRCHRDRSRSRVTPITSPSAPSFRTASRCATTTISPLDGVQRNLTRHDTRPPGASALPQLA